MIVQDVFVCAAKFQRKKSDEFLYLYQFGTDLLEAIFGDVL